MLTKLRRSFRRKRHSYCINCGHADGHGGCYHAREYESLNNSRGVSPASHDSGGSDCNASAVAADPYQDYLLYDKLNLSKGGSLPNEFAVRHPNHSFILSPNPKPNVLFSGSH